jgi:4a-hydroxytetrahydrobiopterin dehydratase
LSAPALPIPDGWRLRGDTLVRQLQFRDFDDAMRFADEVAAHAVDYGRRPDIRVSVNRLRMAVRNLNGAGITEAEIRLAVKADHVLGEWMNAEEFPVRLLDFEGRAAL